MKSGWFIVTVLFLFTLAPGYASDQEKAASGAAEDDWVGKAAVTYYYDSREYSTLNLLTSIKGLPLGLDLWGFTDLHGDQGDDSGTTDLTRSFSEYRLSKSLCSDCVDGIDGFGLMAEYNDFSGSENSLGRFGGYVTHKVELPWGRKGSFQIRVFGYETDGNGWQISTSYFVPFTSRLLLVGFADINFIDGGSDRWVIEPELRWKLDEHISLVAEFRYNDFERSIPGWDGTGLAGGILIDL